jgi:hypothetical protein
MKIDDSRRVMLLDSLKRCCGRRELACAYSSEWLHAQNG